MEGLKQILIAVTVIYFTTMVVIAICIVLGYHLYKLYQKHINK